jgi:hypothetical protein
MATQINGTGSAVRPSPGNRRISVIAQDPGVRRNGRILMATIEVPVETLMAGPVGYRVQVVDYDSSTERFHGSHELPAKVEDEPKAWREGRPSIVENYRFHAQNVYALVMKTLARFEFALGRRIGWAFDVHQIKVAPHGMMDANAFYSRREEGLVFGYFPASTRSGTVYSCLSHDVVVHETTHALIDALRERYLGPSGPDQAAFHEGFSDVIALLSVFSQPELVEELLRQGAKWKALRGQIDARDVKVEALHESVLLGLAEEMGQEMKAVRGEALRRSAKLEPSPKWLEENEYQEAHKRGEIFVAAIMNGFIHAWTERIERDRVAKNQPSFALRSVAEHGADIAAALGTMWIRAIDYMPPVHLEFGDALSAALTADMEVRPDDTRFALRKHMRDSFRAYGIAPTGRQKDGTWEPAPAGLDYERVRFESMRSDPDEVFRFLWENFEKLELRKGAYSKVLSVRPCKRIGVDGFTLHETVAEYYQVAYLRPNELAAKGIKLPREYVAALRREEAEALKRRRKRLKAVQMDESAPQDEPDADLTTPVYGGGVLIFDEYGKLKYHVHNDVFGKRQNDRLQHLWEAGELRAGAKGAELTLGRLSEVHRQRAIDSRRFPTEGW